jgi:hypothetical protein
MGRDGWLRGARTRLAVGLALLVLVASVPGASGARAAPLAAITPFTGAGETPAEIRGSVDAFRAALGPDNGVGPPAPSGRREITWADTPESVSAPRTLPANFYNTQSRRGVVFATPGSGFQVSAAPDSGVPVRFGNIHPTYRPLFETFASPRLFTALGSRRVDVSFFVAGTSVPATVSGFGAVFSDVDNPNTTGVEFFDVAGNSLGQVFAPPGTLAFAAGQVTGPGPRIARVRVTSGNRPLGPLEADPAVDVVAMADLIYGEPQPATPTVTATTTTLTVQPTTATAGQAITLTATVRGAAGATGTPTGSVAFRDGGTTLATVPLQANGQATFTISTLGVGSHTITAAYSGDASFAPSTSNAVPVAVNAAPASVPPVPPVAVVPPLIPPPAPPPLFLPPPPVPFVPAPFAAPTDAGPFPEVPVIPEADPLLLLAGGLLAVGAVARRRGGRLPRRWRYLLAARGHKAPDYETRELNVLPGAPRGEGEGDGVRDHSV